MSLTGPAERAIVALLFVAAALSFLLAAGALDAAFAQTSGPFGMGRSQGPTTGLVGWILTKQAEFYRGLSGLVRAAKADGSAVWGLLALSFAYGVFHAAGPGHGKAVISSYVVANEETWMRGVVLSFASALLQAIVAVAIVGVAAVMLNASARTMNETVRWIEIASYALIALIGARLLWVKGRALIAEWRALHRPKPVGAAATPADHHHDHAHPHHHGRGHRHHHDHGHHDHAHDRDHQHHSHDHADASAWGHAHAPEPQELAGPGGWQRGLAAIVAVGLRPCSGAILVLVFALAQGLFWAGIASTFVMGLGTAITVAVIATIAVAAKGLAKRISAGRSGYGTLALRGVEVVASLAVLAFGVLLLAGYMASERLLGV